MKITKILTASILCLSLILSITACTDGKGSSSTISLTSEQQGVISNAASLLPEDELENKVVKQYGFYDINGAADIVPAINLFEQKYGGKIEYVQVDWDQRFTALANLIMSGESPDIFPREENVWPDGISNNQYAALDEYIDFESPLWSGTKAIADQYLWEGKHYYVPWVTANGDLLIYDKTRFEEFAIDDPMDLYDQGKWDWNAFKAILTEWTEIDDEHIGYRGSNARPWIASTGKAFVGIGEDGKIVNNIRDNDIARVQDFLQQLRLEELITDEYKDPAPAMEEGLTAFYGVGEWALSGIQEKLPDHEIGIVTFPKDPNADEYYIQDGSFGYMVIEGSKNIKGAVAFLSCCRLMQLDADLSQTSKEVMLTERGYEEWQYDYLMDIRSGKHPLIVDNSYGLGASVEDSLSKLLDEPIFRGESWAEIREEHYNVIDEVIKSYNAELK